MNIFATLSRYISDWASTKHLSEMDNTHLSDVGLIRQDLFDVRTKSGAVRAAHFAERRQARANNWLC